MHKQQYCVALGIDSEGEDSFITEHLTNPENLSSLIQRFEVVSITSVA